MSRHELMHEKRKILDLDPDKDAKTWNRMKQAISRCQSIRSKASHSAISHATTQNESINNQGVLSSNDINSRLELTTKLS